MTRIKPDFSNLDRQADMHEVMDLADDILAMIPDLPERAAEFGDSAEATVEGIQRTIERRGFATKAQQSALENIMSGIERWFDN